MLEHGGSVRMRTRSTRELFRSTFLRPAEVGVTFLTRASSSWRWGRLHTAAEEGQAQPAALCQAGGGERRGGCRVGLGAAGWGLKQSLSRDPSLLRGQSERLSRLWGRPPRIAALRLGNLRPFAFSR